MTTGKSGKLRKAEKRLQRRIDDYNKMAAEKRSGGLYSKMDGRGFHCPGSKKK